MVDAALLADAARTGRWFDGASGDGSAEIDAVVLRGLCRERRDEVDAAGVRLRNVHVRGSLDLAGVEVPFPLRLDGCRFDGPLQLDGARLHRLDLTNCPDVPGLVANGLEVRRDLNLSGSTITAAHATTASESRTAAVWLCESHIGGRLIAVGTVIRAGGGRALHADRMRVGGTVRLILGFVADGEVRMLGARIDGSLHLTGAELDGGDGLALHLGVAEIGGSLFLVDSRDGRRPGVRGRIDLTGARVAAQVVIRNATITKPLAAPGDGSPPRRVRETAVRAPRLTVGGEVRLDGECRITGGVDLSSSELGSLHVQRSCRVDAPGATALDLANAELRSSLVVSPGAAMAGSVRLTGCVIHGNLTLRQVTLAAPAGRSALAAQAATVDGDADLQGLSTTSGNLNFRGATIGGALDAAGAVLHNPSGHTLNLHQAVVRGSVRLADGFRSEGRVLLNRALVEGRLDCRGGSFVCPAPTPDNTDGAALDALSCTIRGGMYLGWRQIHPSVRLVGATTTILADDPGAWPRHYELSGLTYDRFEDPDRGAPGLAWSAPARQRWLTGQAGFDAGPFEQAARVFRQHGYAREAEDILIAQREVAARARLHRDRTRRDTVAVVLARLQDVVLRWTVGYGYRPGRVLWMLLGLLVAVLLTVLLPAGRDTFRATDPQGNVYAATGRVVTVADPPPPTGADAGYASTATVRPVADACGQGQVRCFSPVFYAVDTVVPLVSLGQRSTWYPNREAPWGAEMDLWLNLATLLGWVLSSIFLLSFTRLARSA